MLPTTCEMKAHGLLDETLVYWTSDFGRTPKINKDAGRDRWPQCQTVLMGGGGIRGGRDPRTPMPSAPARPTSRFVPTTSPRPSSTLSDSIWRQSCTTSCIAPCPSRPASLFTPCSVHDNWSSVQSKDGAIPGGCSIASMIAYVLSRQSHGQSNLCGLRKTAVRVPGRSRSEYLDPRLDSHAPNTSGIRRLSLDPDKNRSRGATPRRAKASPNAWRDA